MHTPRRSLTLVGAIAGAALALQPLGIAAAADPVAPEAELCDS